MMTRTSLSLFMIALLLFVNSSTAYSGRTDVAIDETAAITKRILKSKTTSIDGVAEPARSRDPDIDQRGLAVYALYNLDKFSVRFTTARTTELERVHSSLALDQETKGGVGAPWTLVSETGGLESSLSYPMRILTQEFLYLGFQNLIDDWLLELSGGPDYGNNDLSYRNKTATETTTETTNNNNNNGDFNNRLLQATFTKLTTEVFNIDGGDSTGEQDYNTNSSLNKDSSSKDG